MSWRASLVRLASHRVDEIRKRLAGVLERRASAELGLALLHAEAEAEVLHASRDAEAGWYKVGYLEGWRARRDAAAVEIACLESEEAGVREALADAFEELKKYEQLEEAARLEALKTAARLEGMAMDEVGGRRAAAGK